MENDKGKFGPIAAVSLGVVGGLFLGSYIWDKDTGAKTLAKHLARLGKLIDQLSDIDPKEVDELKGRIDKLLTAIESSYGITKK